MDRRISPPVLGGKAGSGSAGSSGGSTHSPLLASVRASSPPAPSALSIATGMNQQQSSGSSARVGLLQPSNNSHNNNNAVASLSSPTANGSSGTGSATFGDHKTSASSSSSSSINAAALSQRSPFSCPRHSFGDDPVDLVVTIDKSEIRNDPLTNSQFSVFLITGIHAPIR